MTIKQLIPLLPKVVKYNLKIIFAGKFIWFLLAAFAFFAYFMFQAAWNRAEINEGLIYNLLMFPCVLLVFYPAVFGIRMMRDNRILEIFSVSLTTNIKSGSTPADDLCRYILLSWWLFLIWLHYCYIRSIRSRCLSS